MSTVDTSPDAVAALVERLRYGEPQDRYVVRRRAVAMLEALLARCEKAEKRNEQLTDYYECKMNDRERATRIEAERDDLRAKVEQLQGYIDDNSARTVHSCHEECQRVECRQRREIDDLRGRLEQSEHTAQVMAQAADNLKAHADSLQQQLTAAQARVREWQQAFVDESSKRELAQAREARLREKAQAVVDRWETPLWKDAPATAGYIYDLRAALAQSQEQDGGAK